MRSKAKVVRKYPHDEEELLEPDVCHSEVHRHEAFDNDLDDDLGISPSQEPQILESLHETISPVSQFELKDSRVSAGLGLWAKCFIPSGHTVGPVKRSHENKSLSHAPGVHVESPGTLDRWINGRDDRCAGPDSWLEYIRSTTDSGRHNLMAVQVEEQVFYKSIRNVQAGEEMLLYVRDPVYPERDLGNLNESVQEEEKQYPCDRCGEVFRSKVALRRHETYACNNANAIYTSLNKQFKEVHVQPSPPDEHSIDRTTDIKPPSKDMITSPGSEENRTDDGNSSDRNLSVTSAMGEDEMDLSFPSLCYTQGGIKHFPCENCDKVFTDPSNLQRHIRSQHVGARSHACNDCGKTFATSSGLKQHQHIHSSVKPFQCEVCLKAYTQFSNLCRHKRMHADCRQQINCNDCNQAFSTMTSLSKHRRFCEGMIRNGASFNFPATPNRTPKTRSPPAQSPAFTAAYMSPFFPRPPFPFYPHLGAGFPIFPGVMTPPMLPGDKIPTSASPSLALSANVMVPNPMNPDIKKLDQKRGSEGSEGTDISDASISSDLDSSGSDADSESGFDGKPPMSSTPLLNGLQPRQLHDFTSEKSEKLSSTPLLTGQQPRELLDFTPGESKNLSSTPLLKRVQLKQLHDFTPVKSEKLSSTPLLTGQQPRPLLDFTPGESKNLTSTPMLNGQQPRLLHDFTPMKGEMPGRETTACDLSSKTAEPAEDKPFDLSKTSTPGNNWSGSINYDQPLDLSIKKEVIKQEDTPRRTHIFAKFQSPVETPLRKLHYAYPMAGPMMMDPMYRVDKEKLHNFQEAARMASMAFNPATRLPIPMPTPTFPMMGMGFMARPEMKHVPHMFGKTVNAFHYSPGANKLKERYSCKFCGKIFPRSANLTRHLRTHTGEQPYKCKYCERSFSISSNLQRHVRNIHNKEKPFKCPLCDRCFGQQTNLDRHLKKHESDGPNVVDSPPLHEHELDEKDESYFDEIRNFIGKATEGDDSTPRKDYDANFSITAQIEKQNQLSVEKRPAEDMDEEKEEEVQDAKKPCLENNNSEIELESLMNGFNDTDEEEPISGQSLLGKSSYELSGTAAPLACST